MTELQQAAFGLDEFVRASRSGKKVFYGPLYSAINLLGIADPTTALLQAQALDFFQASIGQPGQGFTRPLRLSETSLDGAPGQLPAGYSYLATSVGVYFPPQLPMGVKDFLTRHSAVFNERHSHRWKMGATQFWPCAEFGHQSKSVAVEIANALVQYGVNGAVGMRQLPSGAELYFPAKEVIKFIVETYEDCYITQDGLPGTAAPYGDPDSNRINPVDGALLFIVMEGWRFEALTA
jgi:hypothetical protein